ncbi:NnrS family protein [uncultured Jannaschia sp.]|uniref:NnrS family protein n=1 Tax=uncultured Jannaschia sp. TaxID=293347 RepID=UPI00262ADD07|nr:NnrS family protein [uncultured Jannaschia sp.]
MSAGTAERMRDWAGPAVLSFGFRPFFLLGGLWAAVAMVVWIVMLSGAAPLPTLFDPVAWHAHAFVFGYLGAVIGGFLLTAVPNWTGRLPVTGWGLGALALLWLAGRVGVGTSIWIGPLAAGALDLAFPVCLGAVLLREVVSGRNWRNLPVLALLAVFAAANGLFHVEGGVGAGARLGLATGLMMIAFVGGRIVPSFTRNWLVKQGVDARPSPPMQGFDKVSLAVTAAALLVWVAWPWHVPTGAALIVAGGLQVLRLARWRGHWTRVEPLVWVLHAGYAFLPLGALVMGAAILAPDRVAPAAAQHLWMAGAVGLMTLAVMTRATLGHTGRALSAGPATTAIYLAVIGATLVRFGAGLWPAAASGLHAVSGTLWIAAFAGFAAIYGPMLLRPKP